MWGIETTDREDQARLWSCRKKSEDFDGDGVSEFLTTWDRAVDSDGALIAGQILFLDPEPGAQPVRPPSEADQARDFQAAALALLTKYPATGLSQAQLFAVGPLQTRAKRMVLESLVQSGAVKRVRNGSAWAYYPGTANV
jgi:hypothetical protein